MYVHDVHIQMYKFVHVNVGQLKQQTVHTTKCIPTLKCIWYMYLD